MDTSTLQILFQNLYNSLDISKEEELYNFRAKVNEECAKQLDLQGLEGYALYHCGEKFAGVTIWVKSHNNKLCYQINLKR